MRFGIKYEKCGGLVPGGDERDHYARTLCEDCYMAALSPSRACDPWSVHSANRENLYLKP